MPQNFEPIAVALSVRPMRSVILVPPVDGVGWQSLFRLALQCHTSTWGGCGNLVLPTFEDGDDFEELFWSVLDVYDADTVHGLTFESATWRSSPPKPIASAFRSESARSSPVYRRSWRRGLRRIWRTDRSIGMECADDFQERLKRRVAPLTAVTVMQGFRHDASDPPHWPLTSSKRYGRFQTKC